MKRILYNLASDLGFLRDPNLEKLKASNLGYKLSLENGIFMKTLQNKDFFRPFLMKYSEINSIIN